MLHNVFERAGKYYSINTAAWKKFGYGEQTGEKLIAKNLTINEARKLVKLLSDKSRLQKLAIASIKK